jgi:hypothetical protein
VIFYEIYLMLGFVFNHLGGNIWWWGENDGSGLIDGFMIKQSMIWVPIKQMIY